ncbi:MAG: ACP S-malonyltransferase [Anaerorhabdus sp.]
MKIAYLFAGQGSQYPGMGYSFYQNFPSSKAIYDDINLDFDVKQLCFYGEEEKLKDTEYAQACILATSLAIASALDTSGIKPQYVAGLSLGEYSALAYAGSIDKDSALEIVRARGKIMAKAMPSGFGKMAAVLNTDQELIENICKEVSNDIEVCEIANYNSPSQIVISGNTNAVDKAIKLLLDSGVRRVIPLNVSGAFHSSLLIEAANSFKGVLDKYNFNECEIPVVYNFSGDETCKSIKDNLLSQLYSSVRFTQSIEYMISKGVDTFVEIGPGNILSGFVRKISKDVRVYSIDSIESMENFIKEVNDGK